MGLTNPMLLKCLFNYIRSALTPSPPPSAYLFLLDVSEISRQMQMFSTNRRDLPHSAPFPFVMGGIADYRVDFVPGFSSV